MLMNKSNKLTHRKAVAALEYVFLILIVLSAFLVFQKYILRGMAGRWRTVGDSFGFGRQYDPKRTKECLFDTVYFHSWYDLKCAESFNCDPSNIPCIQSSIVSCVGACLDNCGDGTCDLGQEGCACSDCASDPSCIVFLPPPPPPPPPPLGVSPTE